MMESTSLYKFSSSNRNVLGTCLPGQALSALMEGLAEGRRRTA